MAAEAVRLDLAIARGRSTQQAVEKALISLLVARRREVPKIHDLLALVRLLPFVEGIPPDAELDLLSDYAVDSRYPTT